MPHGAALPPLPRKAAHYGDWRSAGRRREPGQAPFPEKLPLADFFLGLADALRYVAASRNKVPPMTTAHRIAGLPCQPHQWVGVRFVRRLGGAVRTIVSSGITLAGSLWRPVAPIPTSNPPAAADLEAPLPAKPPRSPRRSCAAAPVPQSLPPGWLAHSLSRRRPARFPTARVRLMRHQRDHRGRSRYPDSCPSNLAGAQPRTRKAGFAVSPAGRRWL